MRRPLRSLVALHASRRRFLVFFLAALAAGAVLRIEPYVGSSATRSGDGPSPQYVVIGREREPRVGDPAARAAIGFYRAVIRGNYERAYSLSVENVWEVSSGRSRVRGLAPESRFVRALEDEIGGDGLPVGIARLDVAWTRRVERPARDDAAAPELLALRFLPAAAAVGPLYEARVRGKLVGNCAISDFARTALLARVDGEWKVLLPGRRRAGDRHWEEWFLPRGDERGADGTGGTVA
jgi:hypothetical protein